jgi:single-strand DNA-binding protein
MSGSLNKVLLIGNLGRDPELKMTPSGQALARFSIATTETWKGADGEKKSKTEWHQIVVWGKQAEIAEKYLRKGAQVLVEGKIQYREYTAQDNVKRYATDIRADHLVMLGSRRDGERDPGPDHDPYGQGGDSTQAPEAPSGGPGDGYEDDIPF